MICLLYAHPYPHRSRANRVLAEAALSVPGVELRSLFDLYPDFAIDVEAEQAALSRASVIVLQHPLYWYGAPGLLKHYFDTVLTLGFAYGPSGRALHQKRCLWVTTTGALEEGYTSEGMHHHVFAEFTTPMRQIARFCGMEFLEPLIVYGAHRIDAEALAQHASRYRARLEALAAPPLEG